MLTGVCGVGFRIGNPIAGRILDNGSWLDLQIWAGLLLLVSWCFPGSRKSGGKRLDCKVQNMIHSSFMRLSSVIDLRYVTQIEMHGTLARLTATADYRP